MSSHHEAVGIVGGEEGGVGRVAFTIAHTCRLRGYDTVVFSASKIYHSRTNEKKKGGGGRKVCCCLFPCEIEDLLFPKKKPQNAADVGSKSAGVITCERV